MLRALFNSVVSWFSRLFGWVGARPKRPVSKVIFVEGDELPSDLPPIDLVVAREDETLWSAGMLCPCGCGRRLEVMLLPGVKPRWDLAVDDQNRPTLLPSVWVSDGCRSHFWLRKGVIEWCNDGN